MSGEGESRNMTTYPIAVIGDRDSIYGYAALGLTIYPTEDAKAAAELIRRLADNGCGIIYLCFLANPAL